MLPDHLSPFVPVLAGFVVALITAPAGVSGAFLLIPFQVTVLGIAGPVATATNLLFNVVATPGSILRYRSEGRLDRPLARTIIVGTLPGVVTGGLLRETVFADPDRFKVFMAIVLLALGGKLLLDVGVALRRPDRDDDAPAPRAGRHSTIVAVSVAVGIVGGIYGIGGGSIIAPYLVGLAGLSIYRVAGAALLATFATSVFGVAFFTLYGLLTGSSVTSAPNWGLGLLFGLGGLVGGYLGARLQRRFSELSVKALLAVLVTALGLNYLASALRVPKR
jgi:uncharacterized membrane protein YfcA